MRNTLLCILLLMTACATDTGPTIDREPDTGDVGVKSMTAAEFAHVGDFVNYWPSAAHISNNNPRVLLVQSWADGDPVIIEGRVYFYDPVGDQTHGNPEDSPLLDPPPVPAIELADTPEVGKATLRPADAQVIGRARIAFDGEDTLSLTTSWQDLDQGSASGDESSASYSSPTLTVSAAGTWDVSLSTSWQRASLITTATVSVAVWHEGDQTDLTLSCFLPILSGGAGCTTAASGPLVLAAGDELVARVQGASSFNADLRGYVLSAVRVSD